MPKNSTRTTTRSPESYLVAQDTADNNMETSGEGNASGSEDDFYPSDNSGDTYTSFDDDYCN